MVWTEEVCSSMITKKHIEDNIYLYYIGALDALLKTENFMIFSFCKYINCELQWDEVYENGPCVGNFRLHYDIVWDRFATNGDFWTWKLLRISCCKPWVNNSLIWTDQAK